LSEDIVPIRTAPVMTSAEALDWKARISSIAHSLRLLLFEGYERRVWEALGYQHWTACLQAIAEEHRFSERHLWRLHAANETEQRLTPGSVGQIPEKYLRPITTLQPDEQREVWSLAVDTAPDGHVTAAHVQTVVDQHYFRVQCTGEQEWYTPQPYIDAARQVLGTIDLDPATSLQAQARIQATRFYTADDDGLSHAWAGHTVFLNPPYTQPLMEQFVDKLLAELQAGHTAEAILLTHNYTDTVWFHKAEAIAQHICFTKGRIRFVRADGFQASPTQGQAFFYFGPHHERFAAVFSAFGFIVQRI